MINYRSFWEICRLQHPVTIQKSTLYEETFSWQTVPVIGYATITFDYEPDWHFIFPLTVWVTKWRPRTFSDWTYAESKSQESFLKSRGSEERVLLSQYAIAILTKTNFIFIYHKLWVSKPNIRCVLTLGVLAVRITCLKRLIHTSHFVLLFNRTRMQ